MSINKNLAITFSIASLFVLILAAIFVSSQKSLSTTPAPQATPSPALSDPIPSPLSGKVDPSGQICGGIAGFVCPDGYECVGQDNYPDASGTCVKKSTPSTPTTTYFIPNNWQKGTSSQEWDTKDQCLSVTIKKAATNQTINDYISQKFSPAMLNELLIPGYKSKFGETVTVPASGVGEVATIMVRYGNYIYDFGFVVPSLETPKSCQNTQDRDINTFINSEIAFQ